MNPLYEGQVVDHKDLERLNCSDFGVSPDQVVLDTRKDPGGNLNILPKSIVMNILSKSTVVVFDRNIPCPVNID